MKGNNILKMGFFLLARNFATEDREARKIAIGGQRYIFFSVFLCLRGNAAFYDACSISKNEDPALYS